jgi:mono/diheme cytochrome c family protein
MKQPLLAVVFLLAAASAPAVDDKMNPPEPPGYPQRDSQEASIYRGSIVFHHYCELCHGVNADGKGRAAKLYTPPGPANLVMSDKNDAYKNLIIRRGGKMLGRSEFMPPWGNELTDEQITDVVAFLGSIRSPKVEVK